MWNLWPKTASEWATLLATADPSSDASRLLQPATAKPVFVWAHYAFDATVFAAKAIAAVWDECGVDENGEHHIQVCASKH
jgi:hypothetical protein